MSPLSYETQAGKRDLPGATGRGFILLLALAMPVLPLLEGIRLQNGFPLPVASLLTLVIALTAAVKVIRGECRLPGWPFAAIISILIALSGFGILARGGQALLGVTQMWGYLLLVTSVAVHYMDQRVERVGVLVAFIISGTVAALLAAGQSFSIEGATGIARMLGGGEDSWSLLPRVSGTLSGGEAFAWLMAVLLPLATAGVVSLEGKPRELAALLVAIFWYALLSTYSLIAPLAGLAGVLVVILSRQGLRRPNPAIAIAMVLATLFALANPVLRARWFQPEPPLAMTVRAVTTIDTPAEDDSLSFIVVNTGPLSWPQGFEFGYHLLYPSSEEDVSGIRLLRGGWVGRSLGVRVDPGEQVEVVLPFAGRVSRGFISPDLRFNELLLSTELDLAYVFAYEARSRNSSRDLRSLVPIQQPDYIKAVQEAIDRGQERKRLRGRAEVLRDAFSLMQAHPFLGLGPGAMQAMLGYDSQSLLIEIALAYGWVGLAAMLLILVLLNTRLLVRATVESIALSGALIVILIHSLSAYVHTDLTVAWLTALLLGLIWAAGGRDREVDDGR